MTDKVRYPWDVAHGLASSIVNALRPYCVRIEIAGSLRRQKETVGDIEILYIPLIRDEIPEGKLFREPVNIADKAISRLLAGGTLDYRLNKDGHRAFGEWNKLMLHVASGVPVDLFAATPENWWNYLVCRTGPAALNTRISNAARSRGWMWNPYGAGFTRDPISLRDTDRGEIHAVHSEAEVFVFVGLPCIYPWERDRLVGSAMSTFRGSA